MFSAASRRRTAKPYKERKAPFFVKHEEKAFLVSAKHLVTGFSTSHAEKEKLYPDTLSYGSRYQREGHDYLSY